MRLSAFFGVDCISVRIIGSSFCFRYLFVLISVIIWIRYLTTVSENGGLHPFQNDREYGDQDLLGDFIGIRQCGCDHFCPFRGLWEPSRMFLPWAEISQGRRSVRFHLMSNGIFRLAGRRDFIAFPFFLQALIRPIPIIRITNVRCNDSF